jgi:hypothetical protein
MIVPARRISLKDGHVYGQVGSVYTSRLLILVKTGGWPCLTKILLERHKEFMDAPSKSTGSPVSFFPFFFGIFATRRGTALFQAIGAYLTFGPMN